MAKRIDFFDGAESSTTPDFSGLDSSGLVRYANDAAYEADNAGSPVGGNSYYNTTLDTVRYYDDNAMAWTSIVSELQKGAANGVAPLNALTKIDATYLPSYVDDVEEYANLAAFPVTGETGKIYVALDSNNTYRWTGSVYVEISPNSITSVNGQTGVVVLDVEDLNDVGFTSLSARDVLKRNLANTEWENFNLDSSANDAATGSNQTLTAIATSVVRLTSNTLTSIDMIPAGYDGQKCIIINASTVQVTINNETGATAANRILTGTGAALQVAADANIWLTYDATTARWRVVGGTGAAGVNQTLSNLTAPTAINEDLRFATTRTAVLQNDVYLKSRNGANSADIDLIKLDAFNRTVLNSGAGLPILLEKNLYPSANNTYTVATASVAMAEVHSRNFNLSNGGEFARISDGATTPSGATNTVGFRSTAGAAVSMFTSNSAVADANPTANSYWETGNKTAGTGGSGNLIARTGTSAGGTRGKLLIQDGTQGTVGHVWTQTASDGTGSWQAAGGGGANTSLSNLVGPTAINEDLIFDKSAPIIQSKNQISTNNSEDITITSGTTVDGNSGSAILAAAYPSGTGTRGLARVQGRIALLQGDETSTIEGPNNVSVSTDGNLDIYPYNSTTTPALKLWELLGNFGVTLKVSDSLAADYTLTLPLNDGVAGQVLSTDGSGVLSWVNKPTWEKQTFPLSAGDITNGYVDLSNVAVNDSIDFVFNGLLSREGTDYTVNYTGGAGGNTRISFGAHTPALTAADTIIIKYQY
jgi:hypothetical protein